MQIKIFTIPIFSSEAETHEMNKFVRANRVVDIKQEFISIHDSAYWCFCVRYLVGENKSVGTAKKEAVDYKTVLKESEFTVFTKLREFRKQISKDNAVPAYAVFTDAELSEIAKLNVINSNSIKTIKGIGEKKTEKYGTLISQMFNKDEKSS